MKKIVPVLCVILGLLNSQNIYAQEESTIFDDSMRDITIVAGLGVGGAVLGLSTLSFVEEPSDHLKNIVVGGAIGIIIGVAVVAYSQASKSQQYFETSQTSLDFSTKERINWHTAQNMHSVELFNQAQPKLNYTFSF